MNKYDPFSKIFSSCLHPFDLVEQAPSLTEPDPLRAKLWRDSSNNWCCLSRLDGVFFPSVLTSASDARDFRHAFASGKDALFLAEDGRPLALVDAGSLAAALLAEVNHSHALMEAVLSTADELVVAIDENGEVDLFNERASQMYKIRGQEIIGRPITDFFSNLQITKVQYNAITTGQAVRDKYHQPVLGSHVLINASPVLLEDGVVGAVSMEREISETMRLSSELTLSNKKVSNLQREIEEINRPAEAFDKIYGRSDALTSVVDMAKRVANTDVSILLRGESGTGKELFAEAIHRAGKRRDKPFVVINCGAIPASLFESELFGYQPGSFTGADKRGRKGKFDEANQGTLFLDEVGELSPDMQVKLLRVLQNQRFYRVGGGDPIHVDVRVISATNRHLEDMIEDGSFRDDLYYRINVVSLEIPPLRERREDISQLVYLFVREFCLKQGIAAKHIEPEVINYLINYSWPGNIRELRNVVERLVVLSEANNITIDSLPGLIKYGEDEQTGETFAGGLANITDKAERDVIMQALDKCNGDRSRAARLLNIPRSTLYYKLNKYHLNNKNINHV